MGELHLGALEILVDCMLREFKVSAEVCQLQVAYRETIRASVNQEYKYAKQSGGDQYGHVYPLLSTISTLFRPLCFAVYKALSLIL